MPVVRNHHSRVKQKLSFGEEVSRTKQQFKDDADINNIVARWLQTGVDPAMIQRGEARYADFTTVDDYLTMQYKLAGVRSDFELLPGPVRFEFDNDPAKLIEYLADPANTAEAIKRGLLPKPNEAEVLPSPPAPEQPPAGQSPAPEQGAE